MSLLAELRCFIFIFLTSSFIIEVIPIQLQEGEELKDNNVENSQLNECLSVQGTSSVGFCFGKEVLNNMNKFDEAESFSLATGISFVRDEKAPRGFGSFLDKDPMDVRAMLEDASNLISKRSLHWDLSGLYPGLVMKIGPTLANGVLEFVMDRRIKDRTYNAHQPPTEMSTGRLLARSLLVPFLLGFKFQLSTLLPLLLGVLLLASKKAFILAKIALLAVTVFSSSGFGGHGGLGSYPTPSLSSYTSYDSPVHHAYQGSGGYYSKHANQPDYFYPDKPDDQTTAAPITPDELRDRLERLFVTKKEIDQPRDENRIRNARGFSWTPINTG